MTVIICSLDFPEFWFGFIMIGEWRCQWSLLPVSSHPVIWINLSLIGTTALKCGETNPFLVASIVPGGDESERVERAGG